MRNEIMKDGGNVPFLYLVFSVVLCCVQTQRCFPSSVNPGADYNCVST